MTTIGVARRSGSPRRLTSSWVSGFLPAPGLAVIAAFSFGAATADPSSASVPPQTESHGPSPSEPDHPSSEEGE
jgi:hypothetical protein